MAILITGVAGLIGSRLAKYIEDNYPEITIVGIDDLSGGYFENVPKSVKFYDYDLSYDDISELFLLYDIDYVYHFACYAAEGLSPFMRQFNYSNNIGSTVNIINNCINYDVKRLIYASSMSVYGHGDYVNIFDEKDQQCPIDPYGISKYACEMDIRVAGEQHGLDWCIIRPHNVFGVNQNIWDRYRNVLGIWMYQILNNQPISIFGDGNQVRAFTFIDNILPCLDLARHSDKCSKEIINLGGTIPHSINDMAEMLCDIVIKDGYTPKIVRKEKRHEVFHAVPTYQKSIDLLNYNEFIDLKTGLKLMWEWAKCQPNRPRMTWDKYEVEKGIYSFWK